MESSWKPLIIVGILAFIIFNPLAFSLTNAILSPLGLNTTDYYGRPTQIGLILHVLIFILILKLLLKV
ncbi:hypothetical protein D3C87_806310 [compost metagenome]